MATKNVVAKNTVSLYLRMFVTILIGLISSRLTLKYLGETDYGIYNVVAGITVLFSFLNTALTAGVQRFLNFYQGRNDNEKLKVIFAQSFFAFVGLALLIVIVAETVGIFLLEQYMNIPPDRMNAARILYQISIGCTFFSVMRIPFHAVVISYEKMGFYALMSILESVFKLVTCLMIINSPIDSLLMYGLGLLGSAVIIFVAYIIYTKVKFSIINLKRYKDKTFLKQIFKFSGWNVLGTASSVLTNQGNNIMINRYFDVTVNAAFGVANNANNIVYAFLTGFQTAFNPHITKLYSQNKKEECNEFVAKMSKLSFLLMYFIILPFIVNIDFVLQIWLGDVPAYSSTFLIILCALTLLDALGGPLWTLNEAEGNIRTYQIVSFSLCIPVLGFTALAFILGGDAYWGFVIHLLVAMPFTIWRVFYLHKKLNFNWKKYVSDDIIPLLSICVISFPSVYFIKKITTNEIASFFVSCVFSVVLLLFLYVAFGLNNEEKYASRSVIIGFMNKKPLLSKLYHRYFSKTISRRNKHKIRCEDNIRHKISEQKKIELLFVVSLRSSVPYLSEICHSLNQDQFDINIAIKPSIFAIRKSIRDQAAMLEDDLRNQLSNALPNTQVYSSSESKKLKLNKFDYILIDSPDNSFVYRKYLIRHMSKKSLLCYFDGNNNYPFDYIYNKYIFENDLNSFTFFFARNAVSCEKINDISSSLNIHTKVVDIQKQITPSEKTNLYIVSSNDVFEDSSLVKILKEKIASLDESISVLIRWTSYDNDLRVESPQATLERIPEYINEMSERTNISFDINNPYFYTKGNVVITDDKVIKDDYKNISDVIYYNGSDVESLNNVFEQVIKEGRYNNRVIESKNKNNYEIITSELRLIS